MGAKALLGSSPQLSSCNARSLTQCRELGPDDARMNLARGRKAGKTAIGAGNHVLAPDDASKAADPLRNGLGMLDEVGGVGDDPRDQQLTVRQFDILPDAPFMFVTRVAGFKLIGTGLHSEHDVDYML